MNAKVIKRFKDKDTGEVRAVGDVFECTEARFKEILEVGPFVEEIELPKPKRTRKKAAAKPAAKADAAE